MGGGLTALLGGSREVEAFLFLVPFRRTAFPVFWGDGGGPSPVLCNGYQIEEVLGQILVNLRGSHQQPR